MKIHESNNHFKGESSIGQVSVDLTKCEEIDGTIPRGIDSERSMFLRSFSFLPFFPDTNVSVTVHHEHKGIKTGSHNKNFSLSFL